MMNANVEKFENFLEKLQLRPAFSCMEDESHGSSYYKSFYKGLMGEFEYTVCLHGDGSFEIVSPFVGVQGAILRHSVLKEINALNSTFKGLKFIINKEDEVVMIYSHGDGKGEFVPEIDLDNAIALFQQANEKLTPMIIELHKVKEKFNN
ncbi:hypothetical protein SAMN02745248_02089 [Hathewaya proteolytica DSM 3090]|uniref:Sensory transduction regulator n=1 Tax=Hathewaya proteolytica DSM 3090 TaxID=1121331 RepID=A0A1M6QRE3_9CLOT|nr:hypothetical protein [Hathewaya proteolytica]SHK22804.1 hypothetical protein SAMN02745248_02089 [Hathewaya proteolytica DSM 3090]